jgi:pyridoxal phosphate enzyme (YggS family)
MSDAIAKNVARLLAQVPEGVRLVAVSKTHAAAKIRAAYQAGLRDFAENRLQEALAKQAELVDLTDIRWHFIGHLQKNKAKKAIAHFDWIHTIDNLALLQKLNQYASESENKPKFCLQIKPLPDPNKFGWEIPAFLQDLPHITQCKQLNIQGLMTILPLGLTPQEISLAFRKIHDLQAQLNKEANFPFQLNELSMGMSGDYALAIAEGSTMVRIGHAIFGERL